MRRRERCGKRVGRGYFWNCLVERGVKHSDNGNTGQQLLQPIKYGNVGGDVQRRQRFERAQCVKHSGRDPCGIHERWATMDDATSDGVNGDATRVIALVQRVKSAEYLFDGVRDIGNIRTFSDPVLRRDREHDGCVWRADSFDDAAYSQRDGRLLHHICIHRSG